MSRLKRSARDGGTGERTLTSGEVKSRAVSGVAILLGRGIAFRILGLLGNLVLARLLTPEDFGYVAIGLSVVAIGSILGGAGFGALLISREEQPSHRELRAVAGLQIVVTSVIGAVAAGIAVMVGGSALATATMMLALPLTAISAPATLLFTRRMQFSRILRIEIAEILAYLAVAITLASLGFGVWSLALAYVLRAAVGALVAVRISPAGFVVPKWDLEALRPMLAFGTRFQMTTIVDIGSDVALTAGIAAFGGLTLVGLWSFAGKLLQAPNLLFETLFNVGFPALSRLDSAGEDDAVTKRLVEDLVTVLSIGMALVMCPIVASAPAAVPVIFGDAWTGVSEILPGAGVALVLGAPVASVLYALLYARGDAHTALMASVVAAATRLPVSLALLPIIGAWAIGIGWAAAELVQTAFTLPRIRRMIGARLAGRIFPPCVLASIATAAGWIVAEELGRTVISVLASAAVGGLGFVLLLVVLLPRHTRTVVTMTRSVRRHAFGSPGSAASP